MALAYEDSWIRCTPEAIEVRGYYFPWGTKRIPYDSIRSIATVNLGALTGRGRIWGTGNPRRWANFDPRRPTKTVGFDVDLGAAVKPLLTPDDPQAFASAVNAHVGPGVLEAGGRRRSSLI